MANEPNPGTNKSSFVEDVLKRNPQAKDRDVNVAWKAAGNDGTISTSLVYKVKTELGMTGMKPSKGRPTSKLPRSKRVGAGKRFARKSEPSESPRPLPSRSLKRDETSGSVYADLEADIDRLLFRIMEVEGMLDIEDALRRVRRLVVRRHED